MNAVDQLLASVDWQPIENLDQDAIKSGALVATFQGVLDVGGIKLRCYILSDGQRVFDADDVQRFFGGEFWHSGQ